MVALIPCPSPQTAPTRAARYHGRPQHRGISAARWSGPAIAWRDPANTPPSIVSVRAEMASRDFEARLFMGGVKASSDGDLFESVFVSRDDGLGKAWREDCLLRMLVVGMGLFIPEVVANVLDEMGEDEKAWLPLAASITVRMAMYAHDDVFCLDVMMATALNV